MGAGVIHPIQVRTFWSATSMILMAVCGAAFLAWLFIALITAWRALP